MTERHTRALAVSALLLTMAGPLCAEACPEEIPGGPPASVPGPTSPASPDAVRELIRRDRYEEAEGKARELLHATEATRGCESIEVATVLDLLVEALTRGGKTRSEETLELADRAITIREKALGLDDSGLSESLVLMGNLLVSRGKRSEARPLLERALALAMQAHGPDAVPVGRVHNALGALYSSVDFGASERHHQEALRIFEVAGEPDGKGTAAALNGLGGCAMRRVRFAEAEKFWLRALRILQQVDGPRASSVAAISSNLGNVYNGTGDYERARGYLLQALSIQEELFGPRHPSLVNTLGNLAITEGSMGLPADARFEQTILVADETLGADHPLAAQARANYGITVREFDIAKARRLWEQALAVLTKTYEPTNPDVLWILELVGEGALLVGDLTTADRYLQQSVAGNEKSPDSNPWEFGAALGELGKCRAEQGRTAEARLLWERSLKLLEKTFGGEHPEVASHLTEFGRFLKRHGTLGEADSAFARALAIREKTLGETHYRVAESLFALADVRFEEGRGREARGLFGRAVGIQHVAMTPDDPRNADGLRKYAFFLLETGEPRAALEAALRAESLSRRQLRLTIASLSERNALSLVAKTPSALDIGISAASTLREPGSARAALDALIRSRGIVLDEMGERHRVMRATRLPDVSRLLDDFVAARTRLANLTVMGEDEKSPAKYRKRLEEARAAKEAAERGLAERSADFRRRRSQAGSGLTEVARALPEGAALVAFVRHALYSASPRSRSGSKPTPPADSYTAFVLRHGSAAPVLVPLGPASVIDAQVAAVRDSIAQVAAVPGGLGGIGSFAEASYRRTCLALRGLVWKPLEPLLAGVATVFLVPDGSLQLVSFGALPDGTDRYLLEKGPVLHYLSAERDLVYTALPPGDGLMLAGAPDFDERPPAITQIPAGARSLHPSTTTASAVFRGALLPSCRTFDSMRFEALPSASLEIDDVAVAWRSSTGKGRGVSSSGDPEVEPLVYSGAAASETAVKRDAPGRRVVHFATHGFFMGACPSAPGNDATRPTRSAGFFTENPLLLSGLAFAGANLRSAATPGTDDGILTAEEIAALDLAGVEWAVLSACETGVGELRSGEGLFGLRRAFQIAGARSLILSLWAVEDEASRNWMKALYRNRLARRMTTARAVHEASREALLKRRAAGQSTHPFYWAGFVATGDWR